MTGYQVEFVDDAIPTAGTAVQRPSRPRIAPISLIAPALWFSAAALCVLAGTRVLWTYSFGGTISSSGGYDAWGRPLDHSLAGDHGPRYAVVLWLCAALFTLLAVVRCAAARHLVPIGYSSTLPLPLPLSGSASRPCWLGFSPASG